MGVLPILVYEGGHGPQRDRGIAGPLRPLGIRRWQAVPERRQRSLPCVRDRARTAAITRITSAASPTGNRETADDQIAHGQRVGPSLRHIANYGPRTGGEVVGDRAMLDGPLTGGLSVRDPSSKEMK